MLRVPRGCPLIPRSQVEGGDLLPRSCDHLQAYRQSAGVETARHAERRQAIVVGEDREFGRESLRAFARLMDRGHGRWGGRKEQDVEVGEGQIGYGFPIFLDGIQPTTRVAEGYGGFAKRTTEAADHLNSGFERGHDLRSSAEVLAHANPEVFV